MSPRVVGIDPSTVRTGVALPDGRTLSISPRVQVPKDSAGTLRVRRVADIGIQLMLALKRQAMPIDVAVVEGYLLKGPGGPWTLIRLVEVGLMVRFVLDQLHVPFVELAPSTLKRFSAGSGGADKDEMVKAAKAAGGRPANHDEADAFLLHRFGVTYYGDWDGLDQYQRNMLVAHEWPKIAVPA